MKNILLSLLFVVVPVISNAQAPPIQWQKCFGGTNEDGAVSIKPALDGGYVLLGYNMSSDGDATTCKGLRDYWIVRINDTGSIIWQRSLGGTNNDYGYDVWQTLDSGFIVVGASFSNDSDVTGYHGGADNWIVRLSKTGSLIWQHCLGSIGDDDGRSVLQNADSSYVIAGGSGYNSGDVTGNHGNMDVWVVKLSPSGIIAWQKCYGGTGGEEAYAIEHTSDGGYIVAGNSNSNNGDVTGNHGNSDAWIIKISSSGSLQWQRSYGGSGYDIAWDIKQTFDGGYIVSGFTNSNDGDVSGNKGGYDYWLLKISATGSIVWQRTFGGTQDDRAFSIAQTSDSGFIFVGYSESNDGEVTGNHGISDNWVVKASSTGSIQWQRCYGGSGRELGYPSIKTTPDSGYIFCGTTYSNDGDVSGNHGWFDMWVVKLGPDTATTVHYNGIKPVVQGNSNIVVFPNPTESIINISGAATATTRLYNMSGQLLKETTGTRSIPVAKYVPGVYFVKIYDEKGDLIYQGSVVKQ